MERNVIIASTLEEAVSCKRSDAAFYAGGTEIGRLGSPVDAKTLILLKKIPELYGISVTGDPETEHPSGSWLRIGAMCSFQEILDCGAAPAWLKTAVRYLANLPRRFKATIGGNIASWRSDSYLIPALLAAGTKLEIAGMEEGEGLKQSGKGAVMRRRVLPLTDYMQEREKLGSWLITAVFADASDDLELLAKKFSNTAQSHAYLSLAMGKKGEDYRIGMAILGYGIYAPGILNWSRAWKEAGVRDDLYGSEAYKRYLAGITLDEFYECLNKESAAENITIEDADSGRDKRRGDIFCPRMQASARQTRQQNSHPGHSVRVQDYVQGGGGTR